MTGSMLTVGPDQQYSTIAAAIADAQSGDTVQVMAGTYINDFANINVDITLEGVGGIVNMVCTEQIPNGKGIFVTNGNITIKNFSFSGAQVDPSDNNGAGIRYESGNLVLNNDSFFNNENGLLGGVDPAGSITINSCEFSNNGVSDPGMAGYGHTHNLYVGEVGTLTIDNSYFHDANIGHEIKSRALNTVVTNSRIEDGSAGTASYSIDLPNGGNALIQNNVIEKGPMSENSTIITIGEEGSVYNNTSIWVTGNQIFNDSLSPSVLAVRNTTTAIAEITGNQFYGLTESQVAVGPNTLLDNLFFGLSRSALDPTILDSSGAAAAVMIAGSPSDTITGNWTGTPSHTAVLGGAGVSFFGSRDSFSTPTVYSSSASLIGNDTGVPPGQDILLFGH
jgi:hypothetical protein